MTSFDEFLNDLQILIKKYESQNVQIKTEHDFESDIVKIFGPKFDSLSRAKNGLSDVSELAYTTAEHHPYWNLLYGCAQISQTVLEKWNDELSDDDLNELKWIIRELTETCNKIHDKQNLRQR